MKYLGMKASNNPAKPDPKWKFELVEMDNSEDPKIGSKVKTLNGFKIISPEMALAIFVQKLVAMFEKHTNKEVLKIKFRPTEGILTRLQKKGIKVTAEFIKKDLVYRPVIKENTNN
uniref:Uncharacterized protein n=1 Tax=Panagrolaimus sp. ES5 TaxID=591445 RepID=A0AC34GNR1_9BILA